MDQQEPVPSDPLAPQDSTGPWGGRRGEGPSQVSHPGEQPASKRPRGRRGRGSRTHQQPLCPKLSQKAPGLARNGGQHTQGPPSWAVGPLGAAAPPGCQSPLLRFPVAALPRLAA